MNLSKISVRYAKAIFLLAKEKNILNEVYKDFGLIKESIQLVPEFKDVISSPVISPKDKLKVLTNVFGKSVHEISMKFLALVIDKNRESYILDIARNFEVQYRKEHNIKEVIVTTQHTLNKDSADKISKIVAESFDSKVEIKNVQNDDMIGGVVIRIDNQQLDLSVKTQLQEINRSLKKKSYKKII